MRSIGYMILEAGVRLAGSKRIFSLNEAEFSAYVARHAASQKTLPPKCIGKRHRLRELTVDGRPCYVITPKGDRRVSNKQVVFLHGGGFIMETILIHWHIVSKLVSRLGITVWLPAYPLAPRHTFKDAVKMVLAVYAGILENCAPENIAFLGDSAGASLGIMACHHNKTFAKPLPMPGKLILVSPGTDIPPDEELLREMRKIQPHDPLLAVGFMNSLASLMKLGSDRSNYFEAPMQGDFTGFPDMHVFSGTYEIFHAQAPKLVERARSAGVNARLYIGEKMMHVWPYIPFAREGRKALEQIFDIIRE